MFWIGKCESAATGIKLMVQSVRLLFVGGVASLIRIWKRKKNDEMMQISAFKIPRDTHCTSTAHNNFLATKILLLNFKTFLK